MQKQKSLQKFVTDHLLNLPQNLPAQVKHTDRLHMYAKKKKFATDFFCLIHYLKLPSLSITQIGAKKDEKT